MPPSRGTRLNRGGRRCAGSGAGGRGPGAKPRLSRSSCLSGRDCGLRRAPAPRQFGLRLKAGDLRPLTVSRGPAGRRGRRRGYGAFLARSGAGEWGAGQAGGAGRRSLREGC